jgi:hypothetical protein
LLRDGQFPWELCCRFRLRSMITAAYGSLTARRMQSSVSTQQGLRFALVVAR